MTPQDPKNRFSGSLFFSILGLGLGAVFLILALAEVLRVLFKILGVY